MTSEIAFGNKLQSIISARVVDPSAQTESDGRPRSGSIGRLVDRHVGRVLVRAAAMTRRKFPTPEKPAHVAVSVLGAIGDALIASAVMQDIRRCFPETRITLIASTSNNAIASLLPMIDAVVVVPTGRPDIAARTIRAIMFDLFVDCNQWLRISALHAASAKCFSIGFRTEGQDRHHAYDCWVDHLPTRHELDNFRALLAPIGIVPRAQPCVVIPPKARDEVAQSLHDQAGSEKFAGMIVLHPWAGGANAGLKEWPSEYWVALAAHLEELGFRIWLTGSRSDVGKANKLVEMADECRVTIHSIAGQFSLPQTAALLASATAVVSVNTGIMHLAAAIGVPLVALHGPTNPARWGPVSDTAVSLIPEGMPGGYLNLGFEFPKNALNCMVAISVEKVLSSLLTLLNQSNLDGCSQEVVSADGSLLH